MDSNTKLNSLLQSPLEHHEYKKSFQSSEFYDIFMFCKWHLHPFRSNSAFFFCTWRSIRGEVVLVCVCEGAGVQINHLKSIYKCTDAGRLACGHSVEVLFGVYVVSTSISHLSTRRRQRRKDMFSVTFSDLWAQTSECDLGDLTAFCLHVGFSHSFFSNTPAVHTWKIPATSQDSLFPGTLSSVALLASVARCNFQLAPAKRHSLETAFVMSPRALVTPAVLSSHSYFPPSEINVLFSFQTSQCDNTGWLSAGVQNPVFSWKDEHSRIHMFLRDRTEFLHIYVYIYTIVTTDMYMCLISDHCLPKAATKNKNKHATQCVL